MLLTPLLLSEMYKLHFYFPGLRKHLTLVPVLTRHHKTPDNQAWWPSWTILVGFMRECEPTVISLSAHFNEVAKSDTILSLQSHRWMVSLHRSLFFHIFFSLVHPCGTSGAKITPLITLLRIDHELKSTWRNNFVHPVSLFSVDGSAYWISTIVLHCSAQALLTVVG